MQKYRRRKILAWGMGRGGGSQKIDSIKWWCIFNLFVSPFICSFFFCASLTCKSPTTICIGWLCNMIVLTVVAVSVVAGDDDTVRLPSYSVFIVFELLLHAASESIFSASEFYCSSVKQKRKKKHIFFRLLSGFCERFEFRYIYIYFFPNFGLAKVENKNCWYSANKKIFRLIKRSDDLVWDLAFRAKIDYLLLLNSFFFVINCVQHSLCRSLSDASIFDH